MNISLEFFPPVNLDFNALLSEYKKLEHLDPSFVSVTYGAGGGAENKSLELIKALKKIIWTSLLTSPLLTKALMI